MGTIAVMDKTAGDMPVNWDPNSPDEIEQAEATFDSLRAKGYAAYRVNKEGKRSELITKFDPALERIIMAPPLAGG
jgi:hypothetical protein